MTYADRLQARARELGYTQRQIAAKLRLSASTLNGYFTGSREPDHQTLVKLARTLDTNVDYLLTGEKNAPLSSEKADEAYFALQAELEGLNEQQKEDILRYIRFIKDERK